MHYNTLYSEHDTGNQEKCRWWHHRRTKIIGILPIVFIVITGTLSLILRFIIFPPEKPKTTTILTTSSVPVTTAISTSAMTTTIPQLTTETGPRTSTQVPTTTVPQTTTISITTSTLIRTTTQQLGKL